MSVTTLAFFNNKGGVGKTSLVYHLAWMYADLGLRVVAADLDPQSNLTAAFLSDDRLEQLWPDGEHPNTIFGCVQPLMRGISDITAPYLEYVGMPSEVIDLFSMPDETDFIVLLAGDLLLSGFEDQLSEVWPKCMGSDKRAFRVMSAFWRIIQLAAKQHHADLILTDLGSNLGAINRAVLIAADYVVVPLSPDLFSLQGLRNLGPTLQRWQKQWKERIERNPVPDLELPPGRMQPIGYIVLQHSERLHRPVKAFQRWIARIPEEYRTYVLNESPSGNFSVKNDPHSLALLRNYSSLMPLAHEARKPIFYLKAADGAIGSHLQAVQNVYQDFKQLALVIAEKTGVPLKIS